MEKQTTPQKRPVEQYKHQSKKRGNNPPVGLVDAKTDAFQGKKTYAYDPHLDPTLIWAGKAERTSFEVPTVSLQVHERIGPRSIIEAARNKNGNNYEQLSLFSSKAENPPLREVIDFCKHTHNWSNRMIAGDSLLVMNSLLEKEGLADQVQMVCFDPPYGIKYGSNFQPFVNNRDVKDYAKREIDSESLGEFKQVQLSDGRDYPVSATPTPEGEIFDYRLKDVPHVTLGSIANNEKPKPETLYDQPLVDASRARVTGPFKVEAVPAPMVKSPGELSEEEAAAPMPANESVAPSGATVRQDEWRAELLRGRDQDCRRPGIESLKVVSVS